MANEENLKPFTKNQSREEAKKNGYKGGKASGKARRERKAMKEQMQMLLSLPLKDDRAKAKFEELGINTDDMDNQMALIVSTYKQALKGNMNAMNVIREIIGEKEITVNINQNIDDKVKELNQLLDSDFNE